MAETFTERFNRLTERMSVARVAQILGVTEGAVRKIKRGDTQTIELHRALRLCRELRVSPWILVGEHDPEADAAQLATGRYARIARVTNGVPSSPADFMPRLDEAERTAPLDSMAQKALRQIQTDLQEQIASLRAELRESTQGWLAAADSIRTELRAERVKRVRAQ